MAQFLNTGMLALKYLSSARNIDSNGFIKNDGCFLVTTKYRDRYINMSIAEHNYIRILKQLIVNSRQNNPYK